MTTFIRESQRTEYSFNRWSLVRDPTQSPLAAKRTKTPVAAFQTCFKDASFESLARFVQELSAEKRGNAMPDMFAVLDERSVRDKTVILSILHSAMPAEFREEEWDESKVVTTWKEFRVEFIYACYVAAILEVKPYLFIDELDLGTAHFDETGVFRVPDARLKEWDLVNESGESDDSDDSEG